VFFEPRGAIGCQADVPRDADRPVETEGIHDDLAFVYHAIKKARGTKGWQENRARFLLNGISVFWVAVSGS
jgi:hypothetical protein